jgi:hypothetical protein
MYGTVMVARISVSAEEVHRRAQKWELDRGTSVGFVDRWIMSADDGRLVMAVRFESKEKYLALADDSTQNEWWEREVMPLLVGEPEWIDGEWVDA